MELNLDLNLLAALDALLQERSVGGAAQRMHTSAPAMSRTLARLRRILDDPVLVRAGRVMVPTPRALTLQSPVRDLVAQAQAIFIPPEAPDPATFQRTFAIQAGDGLFSQIGARLLATVHREAPGVTLRFVGESHEDTHSLRDGSVDIEIGQIRPTEPETVIEHLVDDRFVGVVRNGHPLTRGRVTVRRFAVADHVVFSRRGRLRGPIDDLLAEQGLARRVVVSAPSPAGGLVLIQSTDLVGLLPERLGAEALETFGLVSFPVPLPLPPLSLAMAWHPRNAADGGHRWLRDRVRDAVGD
jgi:DNA-binding transcriptional LysR family regulator